MSKQPTEIKVEDLSPKAQETISTKKVTGKGSFKELKKLLVELARFDAVTDALHEKAVNRSILFWVLAVVCGIGTGIAAGVRHDIASSITPNGAIGVIVLAGVITAVLVVFAIINTVRAKRLGKLDLSNDFRLSLTPFLDEIGEDVSMKTKLKIELDLAGVTDAKKVSEQKIPPGRFKKVTETIWADPWCNVAMNLADGSVIMLEIDNTFIKHDRRWTTRSASGKTKFKHKDKWKKLSIVTASLVPPSTAGLSWDDDKVSAKAQQIKLKMAEKKGAKVCRLVGKYKFKAVNEEPAEAVGPQELVGLYMQLYSMLKPAQ